MYLHEDHHTFRDDLYLLEDEAVLALLLEQTVAALQELLRFFVHLVVLLHLLLDLVLQSLQFKLKGTHQINIQLKHSPKDPQGALLVKFEIKPMKKHARGTGRAEDSKWDK